MSPRTQAAGVGAGGAQEPLLGLGVPPPGRVHRGQGAPPQLPPGSGPRRGSPDLLLSVAGGAQGEHGGAATPGPGGRVLQALQHPLHLHSHPLQQDTQASLLHSPLRPGHGPGTLGLGGGGQTPGAGELPPLHLPPGPGAGRDQTGRGSPGGDPQAVPCGEEVHVRLLRDPLRPGHGAPGPEHGAHALPHVSRARPPPGPRAEASAAEQRGAPHPAPPQHSPARARDHRQARGPGALAGPSAPLPAAARPHALHASGEGRSRAHCHRPRLQAGTDPAVRRSASLPFLPRLPPPAGEGPGGERAPLLPDGTGGEEARRVRATETAARLRRPPLPGLPARGVLPRTLLLPAVPALPAPALRPAGGARGGVRPLLGRVLSGGGRIQTRLPADTRALPGNAVRASHQPPGGDGTGRPLHGEDDGRVERHNPLHLRALRSAALLRRDGQSRSSQLLDPHQHHRGDGRVPR